MSLTSCLKKAGPALSADDKRDILSSAAAYRAQGLKPKQAAIQAIQDQLGGLATQLRTMAQGGLNDTTTLPVSAGPGAGGSPGLNAQRVLGARGAFAARAARDEANGRAVYNPALDPVEDDVADAFEPVAQAISKALGTRPVALVRSKEMGADGVHWAGESLVNIEGLEAPALFVAIHESVHDMQVLAREAAAGRGDARAKEALAIWQRMEKAIWSMVPAKERARYAQEALASGLDEKSKNKVREEFLADFTAKRMTDPETLAELARREPTHFEAFAKMIVETLDKVIAALRGTKAELGARDADQYVKDLERAKSIWVDAMVEFAAAGRSDQGATNAAAGPGGTRATPSFSGRDLSPARRKKIDEAAAAALEGGVPESAVQDAAELVAKYEGAPEIQVPPADRARLEAAIAPLVARAKIIQPFFKAEIEALAERLSAKPTVPGVKGLNRAAEKMFADERDKVAPFDPAWLKDLVRGSIIVETMEEVPGAIQAIRETFEVIRVKDRFEKPTDAGYRDVLINVRYRGIVGEVQVHIPEMLAAKELGHLLFEVERALPADGSEAAMLREAQARFYGAAHDAATGAEPRLSRRDGYAPSLEADGMPSRSPNQRSSVAGLVGPFESSQALTSESNSSREIDSSSSSFSRTVPDTAETTWPPGLRKTGNSSLAKNLVPSGNDDKSITGTPEAGSSPDPSIVNLASQPKQFDLRSMKEGSLRVLGDQEAIRAALPDDVKGRKIPGGMLFSPSDAPRARGALEGRKLAYSRAGQVIDRLPMKDGKYVGAPEKFNTPQKIPQLRKLLRQLADEGAPGRFWYENSSKEVLQMAGGDVQEARKMVALLAIYSPQAKVDTNSTFALRAWSQYKAGQPISVKTKVMDDKATAAMDDVDAFWSGEKTGNFFNNLLREIDPSVADKQGATIDMWMMRAAQYESDAPSSTQYAFMENENNRIARDLGWEPQQVQAAIWVAMKARTENKGVKERTEAVSEKKGWIRFDDATDAKGKPKKVRVILEAQKHRDNWLKHAMEHDVTKSDTQTAKFDFSDGLRRHIGQISWEARPGRSTGILPGVNDAPYAQQVEFQQAVQKVLYSDEGADLLAGQLGLLVDGSDILAPGVWQGEIAAGMQKQVAMAPGKGDDKKSIDPSQKQALNLYAATLGLLLRQEGVGWHRPFYKGLKSAENGIELRVGRPFSPDEAQQLWAAVDSAMRDAGVADWERGAGLISSPVGMRVVNFGAVDNNTKFEKLIRAAAESLPFSEVDPVAFSSDSNLVTNDWKEAPSGQGFANAIREAGRSDLLGWAASVLAPRVQSVFDEFSAKYGWGDPGRVEDLFDDAPRFSGRSGRADEASSGRDREVGPGDLPGQAYGVATEGAAAPIEAYHFSQGQRARLSGDFYGTGLRGAEAERLAGATDPRIKRRVYFYFDQGTGIRPESGVGGHAHRVTLNNLYDSADQRLREPGMSFSDFESAVLDAGYDGYLVRLPGTQSGQAVLLGAHSVPVEYLGQGTPGKTQPAPASQAAAALSRKVGGDLVTTKDADVAAIRALSRVREAAPSFRFEFGKARVKADEAAAAVEALEDAGSAVRFSRRSIVSPQSALDGAIRLAEADLRQAIDANKPATLGRTSHVLAMLGAGARPLRMDAAVVQKVFVEKHAGKLGGIPMGDIVRGLYRPALVFKQQGRPNEYELVLPVVTEQGPLTAAVVVDGAEARVKSIYPRSWSAPESGPGLLKWLSDRADSKPVYADEYLAAIAVTGNEDARAQAGIRNSAGSPGDQRPGVADLGNARETSPAQTPAGSGNKNVARPGAPVNQHFVGWGAYRALAKKFGKLQDERDLLRFIGDNYDGEPGDAPAFSGRIGASLTERLNDAKAIELPTGYLVGDYLRSSGNISWWHKTVGTPHDLAAREPLFRPVYNLAQRFIADISTWATKAADLAPNLLPKLERLRDIGKSPLSAADTKALAGPVFEGTLSWTRDWSGAPIKIETAKDKASRLSTEEKARVMMRNGALATGVHKMWLGLKVDQYDALVNSRYEKMALKAGVVWSDPELRTMFNLTEKQIGLYREFRKATDESLRSLTVSDMLRFGGKDLAGVAEEAMSADTVEKARDLLVKHLDKQMADHPERADVLTDTAAKIIAKADQARDLMNRGYAPLQRFGRYTLDVVSADGERLYFSMFETEREANKRARELQAEYPKATVKQGTMSQQQFQLFSGVSPETAELFGEMMGLESNGTGQGDKAFQQYLKLAKSNRSAMKRLIERKGIDGFSEDVGRVLATFVYSNSRQASKNLNFGPLTQAVQAISEEKGQGELLDAAVALRDHISNPQEEAAALRGLLFTQFLGGSIAAGLVNMVQPIQVTFPYLTQWGGVAKAASRMRKALARAVAWESGTKTTGNKDLDKAIKAAEDDGTISPQEVHQLMAQAGGAGSLRSGDGTRAGDMQAKASNLLSKVMLVWGKPFAAAEQFNRRATFIAAWETATQEGIENPSEFARKAIADTQFVYNKGNKPKWARGAVGATLFTFKIYSVSFVEMASRLAKNGPEGRRAALVMLGMLVLISGLQGLPGADDLDDVIDGLMQRLGYSWSTADRKQEIIKAAFGDALGEFVLNGLSGLPGAPIDVSNRLGLGNLIPGTGLLTKKEDYGRDVMEILGPAGSLAQQVMSSAGKLVEGELGQAATAVLPVAGANLAKAIDMASMGMYRDKNGRKVVDTDGVDAVFKGVGFQPRDVAKVQESISVQNRLIAGNRMRESEIADKWAQGMFESNPEKVREAKQDLKRWNESNPGMRIEIDNNQIVRRLREMRLTRAQRLAKTAPAEIRRQVKEDLSR